ncbi:MAG: MlaD family protein [Nitrospirota bacterium]|nr:MlaD family protein [Nitrospirota bacterium]
MKLYYSHRIGEKKIEQMAGVFLLIPLIGFIFGLYEIAVHQHVFDKRFHLFTVLDQSYGIVPGTPVKLAGLTVGEVDTIDFTKLNQILVSMNILKKYENMIRNDSFVTIKKSGIISGDVSLRISIGTPWLPEIQNNARLKAETPLTLEQIMAKLNPTIIDLQRIVRNIADLTSSIDRGKGTVGAILKKQDIYDELQGTAINVKKTSENIKNATDNLPKLIQQLQSVVDDIKKASPALPGITQSANTLLNHTSKTVKTTQSILNGVKQSWPVKSLLPPPPPPLPPLGSSGRGNIPIPDFPSPSGQAP